MTRTMRLGLGLALALYCGTALAIDFTGRSFDCAPNQTVFVSAFQRYVKLKDDAPVKTKYNPTALALGYVWQQDNWKAGAAFTWEHGTRKYDFAPRAYTGDGKVRSDMYGISLFGTMNLASDFYVDASTFLGFRNTRMKRFNIDGVGRFNQSSREHDVVFAMSLEGGRNFMLGDGFVLTPHAGIDYAYTPTESYRMSGPGRRARVTYDSDSFWEMPLGVTLKKTFGYGNWAITPKVDATLVTSLGGHKENAQPGFAYRTADSWKVAGIAGDHLGARLTAGVDARLGDRTSVGLDYTYEGRKDYNDHRISAMFGLSF